MHRFFALALPAALLLLAGQGLAQKKEKRDSRADRRETRKEKRQLMFDAKAFLEEHDTNKDGFLSKDELPGWLRYNFERLDTNKDGKISVQELEKGAAHVQQRRRPSDVVSVLVEMSDCDECCAEELQRLYETLRKLDANRDGKIDADEIKVGRAMVIKERVDTLFKELDRDKDGKISKAEARGQIKAHFDQLDTNKDGFIDRAELTAGAEAKPAEVVKPRRKSDK